MRAGVQFGLRDNIVEAVCRAAAKQNRPARDEDAKGVFRVGLNDGDAALGLRQSAGAALAR